VSVPEEIKQIPLFADLGEEQVAAFWRMGQEMSFRKGELVFSEGDMPRGLYIVLSGELTIIKQIVGRQSVLARIPPGAFVGEISLLTGVPHTASAYAEEDSRLLILGVHLFQDTLNASPVIRIILETMAQRIRATEAMVQQQEKLTALGKMAAGLAHELNNPSAANLRAARQLPAALTLLHDLVFKLNEFNLDQEQLSHLSELQQLLMQRAARPVWLDPLEQSDREEALTSWLQSQGVGEPWRLAPTFVSGGVSVEELADLRDHLGSDIFEDALVWLEGMSTVSGLLTTIQQSASRMCDLVSAIKSYTYMDRSPIQEVNVHEALDDTLTILSHKLQGVTVERHYDPDLPIITAHGSQLNQVWTNLLENAIEAVQGKGHIDIRTWRNGERIVVEFADSGPGIPVEIQRRIFEPFFTTKDVGQGTGLGLDIAYRIVVHEHKGDIRFTTQPGDTRFQVTLPIALGS
jgi:signal transduction histidine kinase